MKYICNDCGEVFSEEECVRSRDFVGFCGDAPAYEDISVCPVCGSDAFEEAEECARCEETSASTEMHHFDNGSLCNICLKALEMKISEYKTKCEEMLKEMICDERIREIAKEIMDEQDF